MWPLKTTARETEFRWKGFQKWISRCSGHFRIIWNHLRLFWGYFLSFLGLNLKLTTETISIGILLLLRLFWVVTWLVNDNFKLRPKKIQMAPKWPQKARRWHIFLQHPQERCFMVNWGYLGAIFCPWLLLSQWRTERDQKFHFWDREKIFII